MDPVTPSSHTLAGKLAKYSYSPSSRSPASPERSKPSISTNEAGPSTLTPTRITPKRKVKREADDDYTLDIESEDEGEGEEASETPSKRAKVKPGTKGSSAEKKKPRPFAGPEVYAHLRPVQDLLMPDLDIVFCGINPGKMSSTMGHHFAHPTNKFWKALHQSGLTNRYVSPAEDSLLPELFNYGLTNLCGRPTSEQAELSTMEMRLNVPDLTSKVRKYRPRVVCFVGKKIWDVYESVAIKTARAGLKVEDVKVEARDGGAGEHVESEIGDVALKRDVKVELEEVMLEADVKPNKTALASPSPAKPKNRSTPTPSPRRMKPPPGPFQWTAPRSLRLLYPEGDGFTYFWVTPSTSGLERTPMPDLVGIFRALKEFVDVLKEGREGDAFLAIDVQGVERTVMEIRLAAEARQS